MRKIFLFLVCPIFLVACNSSTDSLFADNSEFYKVNLDNNVYYFSYPSGSTLKAAAEGGSLIFENCNLNFGEVSQEDLYLPDDKLKRNIRKEGIRSYSAWFNGELPVLYAGLVTDVGFGFWIYDVKGIKEQCVDLIDALTKSFTDILDYVNERFGFALKLPEDFKVDYLDDEQGLVLKKWVEPPPNENLKDPDFPHKIEMYFIPFENFKGYDDIGEFISKEYAGYTIEMVDYPDFSGAYVDESVGTGVEAIRHFFKVGDDKKIIYEAYLKVPSKYYGEGKVIFENVVKTLRFL